MKIGIRFGYGSKEGFRSKVKLWSQCGVEAVELGHEALAYGAADTKNRVEQALDIVQRIGTPAVRIMPDLFHMSIEEVDIPAALLCGGGSVGYVHLADNTRMQPGSGHPDFRSAFRALKETGYDGHLVMECGFSGDLGTSLRRAVGLIRELWPTA